MVVQLVYMGELGYLAIKGIKPNTEKSPYWRTTYLL